MPTINQMLDARILHEKTERTKDTIRGLVVGLIIATMISVPIGMLAVKMIAVTAHNTALADGLTGAKW